MDQAPIDIRYLELLVWLEGRYLIPKDWAKRLELIQVKKNDFLDEFFKKDTPEMEKLQDTFKIFRNNYDAFNYQDLMRLNTMLLKTEEAKSKTLFGNYNSPFIKNAQLLVGVYNKNNMHLCESSKNILQYIGYEIPNLEKNNHYNEKTISDFESKINEKNSLIEKNTQKIRELFKKYDIREIDRGNEIALALAGRMINLEQSLQDIEALVKSSHISEAIKIYRHFYEKIFTQKIEDFDANFLKILKKFNIEGDYLVDNSGNDVLKNYATGISNDKYQIIKNKMKEYKQKYENIDIKADLEANMWNFKLVSGNESSDIEQDKYLTVLLNSKTRKQLVTDLNEILIFITHRLSQSNNKDEINLSIYQNNLRELSLEITTDMLQNCKKFVSDLLTKINNSDFQFLISLFEDEKNLKLILNKFELLKIENENMRKHIHDLETKIEDLKKEISENTKKATHYKKDAKIVKKQMEKFLTDTLKRKITIIGDINLI